MSTGPMGYEERKMSLGGGKTPLQQRFDLAKSGAPQQPGYAYFGTKYGRQGEPIEVFEKVEDAKYKYGSFSDDEAKKFYGTLNKYFPNGWDPSYAENQWVRALNIASDRLTKEGLKITPFQAFDTMLSQAAQFGGLPAGGAGGSGAGGSGAPAIKGQVNLTDPGTAKLLVDQALESYLGRKANERELMAFETALNKREMKSPTSTEVTEGGIAVSGGGFNPSAFAEQYAQGQEGAGEYQAATTLLDTFVSSLKAQV